MATPSVSVGELRNTISTVVKMLANRGIKVTQTGLQAYVKYDEKTLEPVRVNIPSISDTSPPELVTAIKGFVDHEVGHLLFSDADIIARAHREGIANLHNVVEDTYIERKMRETFAGSTKNLDKTVEFAVKAFFQKTFDKLIGDFRDEGELSQARFFVKALSVPGIRALAGQEAAKAFMEDKWHLIPIVHGYLSPLADDIANVDSSRQALKLANTIRDLLCEAEEEEQRQKEQQEDTSAYSGDSDTSDESNGGEDGSSQDSDSEGEPDDRSGDDIFEDDDASPSEDDEGESTEGGDVEQHKESADRSGDAETEEADHDDSNPAGDSEGKGAQGETESNDADESEGDEESADAESDGDSERFKGKDDTNATGEGGDDEVDPSSTGDGRDVGVEGADTLSASGKHSGEMGDHEALKEAIESMTSYDDALSESISEGAVESLVEGGYMPYSTEDDRIEVFNLDPYARERAKERQKRMRSQFADSIGVMSKSLERLMMARNRSMFVPGFRSGRLHSSSLYKLKTGDTRVFRRKEEMRTKNTAVLLLVDCSGSMGYRDRIVIASDAAYALCSSLDRVGIATQVVGFTTDTNDFFYEAQAEVLKISRERSTMVGFDRVEALYMPIYKTFDERLTPDSEQRLAAIPFTSMRNNADGECVEIAADMLRKRSEERKILVVLSDGEPAMASVYSSGFRSMRRAEEHLEKVVREVEDSGIETLGIGIETDAVQHFYPKNIVLDDVAELPTKIVSEMTSMLLR